MAIVSASFAEEILSRQERAVIRGIYRASQLHEALVQLDKVSNTLYPSESVTPYLANTNSQDKQHSNDIRAYLCNAIVNALVSTKIPASTAKNSDPSNKTA